MSKTCILCHIVFGTKNREGTIEPTRKRELYNYLYGIIKSHKCHAIRIGGVEDHVHLLLDLHPSVALADLVKVLKQGSTNWLKQNWLFPMFGGWANGYFATSVGIQGKDNCARYITNQETHHQRMSYLDELRSGIETHGLRWVETDW